MPANRASLKVTERYRAGMVALRRRGQAEAKRVWRQVDPDKLDDTFLVGYLEMAVGTLQREAARLSSAYLSAFVSSELGEPAQPPPVTVWNKAWGGGDLRTGLRSAVVKAKVAIGEGADPREATRNSRAVLVNDVGLFVDTAARESLRAGMQADERIEGWQRAIKGTCGACAGSTAVETTVQLPSIPLNIHPNCQCVTEPVVAPKSPDKTLSPITGSAEGQIVERFLGTRAGQLPYTRQVNAMLRGMDSSGQYSLAQLKDMVRKMDLALRSQKVGQPVRVWRQVKDIDFEVGKTFTDAGYGSTSANNLYKALGEVPGGANLRLTVSPEVRAAWGANPSEAELLLQRGCRYVIHSKTKNKGGGWDIDATVLPPE